MDFNHICDIVLKLMSSDYAIMLSIIVLFQAVYLIWKNVRSLKSPGIFIMTILCVAHVVLYQYGSVRWEFFNYNRFIKIYDTNLWIVIDFVGLLISVGCLYVIDGMLIKLIAKELECDPLDDFKEDYSSYQGFVYKQVATKSK